MFRTIVAQPDPEAVSDAWDEVRDQLTTSLPRVGLLMEQAKTEVLASTALGKAPLAQGLVHQPARADTVDAGDHAAIDSDG